MEESTIAQIMTIAKGMSQQKKAWHFHMLGKLCRFNQHKRKYAIIFEDETNHETLFSLFDEKPLAQSKKLADLMYGQGFLAEGKGGSRNQAFDLILKRVQELSSSGFEWHHHHLHPTCIFNEHKGKHCIILEDGQTGQTLTATYEQKPMGDLVLIERLFYKGLK